MNDYFTNDHEERGYYTSEGPESLKQIWEMLFALFDDNDKCLKFLIQDCRLPIAELIPGGIFERITRKNNYIRNIVFPKEVIYINIYMGFNLESLEILSNILCGYHLGYCNRLTTIIADNAVHIMSPDEGGPLFTIYSCKRIEEINLPKANCIPGISYCDNLQIIDCPRALSMMTQDPETGEILALQNCDKLTYINAPRVDSGSGEEVGYVGEDLKPFNKGHRITIRAEFTDTFENLVNEAKPEIIIIPDYV